MIGRILCLVAAAWVGPLLAQPTLGPLPPRVSEKHVEAEDPLLLYTNRQEAALVAFHVAFDEAKNGNRDRAIRLMLLAVKRNPDLDKALYDLGVLCAQGQRWPDAVKFQKEAQAHAPGSETADLATRELERLEAIVARESGPQGAKRREYDRRLLSALAIKDDIKLLEEANALIKADATRWEGFALAGMQYAATRDYPRAYETLASAARLAPVERSLAARNALKIAGDEAGFIQQVKEAEGYWFDHKYEQAAKAYESAWSPGRSEAGLRAATGYLMADRVESAVSALSRMRASAQPELSAKITAMLKELSAVSDTARREVAHDAASEGVQPEDPAARIRREIGTLTTEQMLVAARPNPPLVPEAAPVPGETSLVVHDSEVTGQEVIYDYKTSIFDLYQANLAPAPPPAQDPSPGLPQLPPLSRQLQPAPRGPEQIVDVLTQPQNASIVLDKDEKPVTCVSPCRVMLASGRHTLLARLPGYRDAIRILEVSRGMRPYEVELDPKRGTVSIESVPSQLPIFLNGRDTGRTTPVPLTLSEGDYEIGVQLNGRLETRKVTVSDGAILTIRFGVN
jgi:hypothetical protein